MNAKVSTPRLVLAMFALALAWAPAATLARPDAEHPAFVARAEAQGRHEARSPATRVDATHDSVRVPAS